MQFMSSKNTNQNTPFIKIFIWSAFVFTGLSGCESFKPVDYAIKDSTYIWSTADEDQIEAKKVVTDYQSIRHLEQDILKSDVQMIFEAMVNNELPGIEPLNEYVSEEIAEEVLPLNSQSELTVEAISVETKVDVIPEQQEIVVVKDEINQEKQIHDHAVDHNAAQIKEINLLNQQVPTAAGISVSKVIPDIKKEVNNVSVVEQLSKLSENIHYQPTSTEFGMWQIAKLPSRPYNEICSLSSATIQVDSKTYATQVWFSVIGDQLLVNSTTNIDISKPQVGIKFDNGETLPFTKSYFTTSAIWVGNLESMLDSHQQLGVSIGGDELGRRNQEFALSLKDLKKAYSEYKACNRGVKIASL